MQLIREERAGDRGLKQTHTHIKKKKSRLQETGGIFMHNFEASC